MPRNREISSKEKIIQLHDLVNVETFLLHLDDVDVLGLSVLI
jgi:hypothetical protein